MLNMALTNLEKELMTLTAAELKVVLKELGITIKSSKVKTKEGMVFNITANNDTKVAACRLLNVRWAEAEFAKITNGTYRSNRPVVVEPAPLVDGAGLAAAQARLKQIQDLQYQNKQDVAVWRGRMFALKNLIGQKAPHLSVLMTEEFLIVARKAAAA
jgi:hypothetical protein